MQPECLEISPSASASKTALHAATPVLCRRADSFSRRSEGVWVPVLVGSAPAHPTRQPGRTPARHGEARHSRPAIPELDCRERANLFSGLNADRAGDALVSVSACSEGSPRPDFSRAAGHHLNPAHNRVSNRGRHPGSATNRHQGSVTPDHICKALIAKRPSGTISLSVGLHTPNLRHQKCAVSAPGIKLPPRAVKSAQPFPSYPRK